MASLQFTLDRTQTLVVAVSLALCDAAGFELAPMELAAACRRAEERAVGLPCGIMDEAVSDDLLQRIRKVISDSAAGAIEVHDLRTRQAGRATWHPTWTAAGS